MMRARIFGLACALGLAAGAASAQNVYLGHLPTDSTLGVTSSAPMQVDVRLGGYSYMQRASVTLHYDPAALHVLGALGVTGDSIVGIDSSRAGAFSFVIDGCMYGSDAAIARVRMQLDPAASAGTVAYLTADSASNNSYYCNGTPVPAFWSAAMTSLCTASTVYGDVDASGAVDSRDALITLSAAVGLPVSGFALQDGDVDADGLVNSRDALIDLSYAIGLATGTSRVGMGIPAACPAKAAPGELLVFRQRAPSSGNDSIAILDSASTVPATVPGGVFQPMGPRLAADGKSIIASCSVYYVGLCRIQRDGTGYRTLFGLDGNYGAPDFNPAGDSIALIQQASASAGRMPSLSDTLGSGLLTLSLNGSFYNRFAGVIAWNRAGSAVAYVNGDGTIWTVNGNGTGDAQLPITGVTDARWVRWSPAGDSLAFTRASEPGIWVVAAAGGTPVQRTTFVSQGQVSGLVIGFDWGPQGLLFASEEPGRMGLWLLAPGGALSRITSGPHVEPSWRRNP